MRDSRHISAREIASFRMKILAFYKKHGRDFPWRKSGCSPYQLIVSEVLLQRTQANTIKAFFPAFIKRYPSWEALAKSTYYDLFYWLEPIGLSRQRTPRLRALAQEIVKRKGRFPSTRHELDKLPGVGQYIGNAIELFVHDSPRPLVDVNMARVLERYFGKRKLADIRYDPYLQDLAHRVVDSPDAKQINWAILDLGALLCKPRDPKCKLCPLKKNCLYLTKNKSALVKT